MKQEWVSPYQSKNFNETLRQIGVTTATVDTNFGSIYFNQLTTDKLTAWEVDLPTTRQKIPESFDVWKFADINQFKKMTWSERSYFSPIITNQPNFHQFYRNSNKRNIKKAIEFGLYTTNNQNNLSEVLSLFNKRKEVRGNIDYKVFKKLTKRLLENKLADIHMVKLDEYVTAAGIIIKSDKIANIRFVASNQEYLPLYPVNLLYHSIISYYFNIGYKIIDLSGTVPPGDSNKKLLSISQFKYGFTHKIATFNNL